MVYATIIQHNVFFLVSLSPKMIFSFSSCMACKNCFFRHSCMASARSLPMSVEKGPNIPRMSCRCSQKSAHPRVYATSWSEYWSLVKSSLVSTSTAYFNTYLLILRSIRFPVLLLKFVATWVPNSNLRKKYININLVINILLFLLKYNKTVKSNLTEFTFSPIRIKIGRLGIGFLTFWASLLGINILVRIYAYSRN